jgi:Integrase core domain
MRNEHGKLWLTLDELAEWGVSEKYIWKVMSENRQRGGSGSWANIQHPDKASQRLIDYDSIPNTTLRKYSIPEKEQLLRELAQAAQELVMRQAQLHQISLPAAVRPDTKELSWLLVQPISSAEAHGLARLAAWLKLLLTAKTKQCLALGYSNKEELYEAALEQIGKEFDQKVLAGQRFSSVQVLKRKVKGYKQDGVKATLHKRAGLKNAEKLIQPQKDLLVRLWGDYHKPDMVVVHRLLMEASETYGWPRVEESTCRAYVNKPAVKPLWTAARHGMKVYHDQFVPITKRDAPSYANAMWVIDGTPLELYYKEGKKAHMRFEVFVVLDAHSWRIVGYSLGASESTPLVREALRMACTSTGYVPYQIHSDNSSAVKSKEARQLLDKLTPHHTCAAVGNARSKTVEPFFKHLNARVLKYFDNYSGSNITAKSVNSHINPDAAKENLKHFASANEAMEQVHLAIALWNTQVGWKKRSSSIEDVYEASMAASQERQMPFTEALEVDAFWHMPEVPVRFTPKGFDLQFRTERYTFDVEDATFRAANYGASFQVKFDPARMHQLYLYQMGRLVVRPDGQPWVAKQKTLVPMALVDRKEGDGANQARLMALKDEGRTLHEQGFAAALAAVPEDYKAPLSVERVHKATLNDALRAVKKLESSGHKTMPMPVIRPIDLYSGDDDLDGPMVAIN